ncbi:unnamed protein product, partial [Mesorhabditis belari]|uniref:Carboxylic ester hydrolase n=1 Tax=Mesorhabditis belari TaxID=2138241 RepID=A0AAF3FR09_9BILA
MILQKLFSILFSSLFPTFIIGDQPLVITKYGAVLGTFQQVSDGTLVNEFLGIPFAQPPIGNLRFEKPKPPITWTRPMNTTIFSKGCTPCKKDNTYYSEDCLYLNVWSNDLAGLQPVIVFIHGGAFMEGNAYTHPAKQWREENIGKFGGDSKRVTIYGESAGSMSVADHTISPQSKGLFANVIEMSGSNMASFGRGLNTVSFSQGYVQALGCANASDYKVCLQSKSANDFLNVKYGYGDICGLSGLNWLGFGPMLDGEFLPTNIQEAMRNADKIPTIMGINQKEGRAFTLQDDSLPMSLPASEWGLATSASMKNYVQNWMVNIGYTPQEKENALNEIFAFFSENKTNDTDHYFWIEQYVLTYSDFIMNIPIVREAVEKTKAGVPVYAFLFEMSNPAQWPTNYPVQGSTHAGEYPWILEMHLNFNYTQADITVKTLIQELFIQFCKTGNPSIPSMHWNPFTVQNFDYLSVNPQTQMKTGWFMKNYKFWTETMAKYSYDYISQSNWIY